MDIKYHVNRRGRAARCIAKPGACPFGGSDEHFPTKEEAEDYSNTVSRDDYGLLPRRRVVMRYKIATTKEDKEYINNRLKELVDEQEDYTYAERCKTAIRLDDYTPSKRMTKHMREDRLPKETALIKEFGKGEIIGHYKVFHLNGKPPAYKNQVIQIWDNGRVSMYDAEQGHGSKVTTFSAHRARIEAIMLMSGQIPDDEFLESVNTNRNKASELGLS